MPWSTSTSLLIVLMNLWPGIRFWLHTTPTSSVCLQSDTPKPFEGQLAKDVSLPVQWTLSSQMRPVVEGTKKVCSGCWSSLWYEASVTNRLLTILKKGCYERFFTVMPYENHFWLHKVRIWRIPNHFFIFCNLNNIFALQWTFCGTKRLSGCYSKFKIIRVYWGGGAQGCTLHKGGRTTVMLENLMQLSFQWTCFTANTMMVQQLQQH